MGYYIDHLADGTQLPARGKAKFLMKDPAVTVLSVPFEHYRGGFQKDLVCVVENGHFDAAGFAFSEQEMRDFNDPRDTRMKTWLIVPGAKKLSGYEKAVMAAHGKCGADGHCDCTSMPWERGDCAEAGCKFCKEAQANV